MTLIPAAGLQLCCHSLGGGLLPVWLGSLGTFFTSMLPGRLRHMVVSIERDLWPILSPISTVYARQQYRNWDCCRSFARQWVVRQRDEYLLPCYIHRFSWVTSTPLNVIFGWSDRLVTYWYCLRVMASNHVPVWSFYLPMSLSWYFDKVCGFTWHSPSIVSCRSGWYFKER